MSPFILHKSITLPLPSENDRRAHDQRIRDSLGLPGLEIPLSVLRTVHRHIDQRRPFSCAIAQTDSGVRLIDVAAERSYSVALDLGSTNLVGLLYDNIRQQDVLTRSLENPQIEYGSDILTRMHHAISGNGEDVYRVLRNGINGLIAMLCEEARINTRDIHALSVAGNTAMSHFFLGLDVSTIPMAPFVPVSRVPGYFTAAELGVDIHPEAVVYVFPNAGSYVGGDIVAGIVATGMHRSEETMVLIDVGTNAEIVIGNREWMIVGAGAAGPALEEGITRIGRRATRGIVYDVEINDGNVTCRTFDQGTPEGICGSGMVSLVYELYRARIMDGSGTLGDSGHVRMIEGERSFVLSCGGDGGLSVTEGEIKNFLRSKAAMFTLLLVLTRSVGIAFGDIRNVCISGALGTGIDARKAEGIGMLPSWQPGVVEARRNTSLEGARMLLTDPLVASTARDMVERITYKHMHDDPEFMKEFLGAVFVPHTDPGLLKAS